MFRAVCFQSGAVTGQSLEAAALNADGVPDANYPYCRDAERAIIAEGPALRTGTKALIRFLQHWRLRPLSVWKTELTDKDWPPWRASLVIRIATFLWFLAGHLGIGLLIIGALFWLGALAES